MIKVLVIKDGKNIITMPVRTLVAKTVFEKLIKLQRPYKLAVLDDDNHVLGREEVKPDDVM